MITQSTNFQAVANLITRPDRPLSSEVVEMMIKDINALCQKSINEVAMMMLNGASRRTVSTILSKRRFEFGVAFNKKYGFYMEEIEEAMQNVAW